MKNNRKIALALVFILTLAVNFLSGRGKINHISTAEVSSNFETLLTPTGLTFVIWGFIYLGLLGYLLYCFDIIKNTQTPAEEELFEEINGFLLYNLTANVAWIFAWQWQNMAAALLLILVVLYSLYKISQLLRTGEYTKRQRLFIHAPFHLYLGWIMVATMANFQAMLVSFDYNVFSYQGGLLTILMLIFACIASIVMYYQNRTPAFLVAIIWALCGILVRHVVGFDLEYPYVAAVTGLCIGVLGIRLFSQKLGDASILKKY